MPTTKIEIIIKRPPEGQAADAAKKGAVRTSKLSDDLGRRRLSNKFINFYDFGVFRPDADSPWQFRTIDAPRSTYAGLADAMNQPLGFEPDDWASLYRKIDYDLADLYRISFMVGSLVSDSRVLIGTDNADWTAKGLKVPASESNFDYLQVLGYYGDNFLVPEAFFEFTHSQASLFMGQTIFKDSTSFQFKLTAEPSYAAAPVLLDLDRSKGFDMFVNMKTWQLDATDPDIEVTPGVFHQSKIRSDVRSWPRDVALDNYFESTDGNLLNQKIIELITGSMGEQKVKSIFDSGTFITTTVDDSGHGDTYDSVNSSQVKIAGTLAGAINQGDSWYYLWHT